MPLVDKWLRSNHTWHGGQSGLSNYCKVDPPRPDRLISCALTAVVQNVREGGEGGSDFAEIIPP